MNDCTQIDQKEYEDFGVQYVTLESINKNLSLFK